MPTRFLFLQRKINRRVDININRETYYGAHSYQQIMTTMWNKRRDTRPSIYMYFKVHSCKTKYFVIQEHLVYHVSIESFMCITSTNALYFLLLIFQSIIQYYVKGTSEWQKHRKTFSKYMRHEIASEHHWKRYAMPLMSMLIEFVVKLNAILYYINVYVHSKRNKHSKQYKSLKAGHLL